MNTEPGPFQVSVSHDRRAPRLDRWQTANGAITARFGYLICLVGIAAVMVCPRGGADEPRKHPESKVIDHSLLVATDLPCTWPAPNWPLFQINHYRRIGPLSA